MSVLKMMLSSVGLTPESGAALENAVFHKSDNPIKKALT